MCCNFNELRLLIIYLLCFEHEIKLSNFFLIISQIRYCKLFQLNVMQILKNKTTCSYFKFPSYWNTKTISFELIWFHVICHTYNFCESYSWASTSLLCALNISNRFELISFHVICHTYNFYESYSWVSNSLLCVLNISNRFENSWDTLWKEIKAYWVQQCNTTCQIASHKN